MFALNFNRVFEDKGITSKEIADYITSRGKPISKESISKYRNGTRTPDPEIISLAAEFAQVDVQEFFGKVKYLKSSNNFDYHYLPVVNVYAGAGSFGHMPDFIEHVEKVPVANKFLNGCNPSYLSILQVVGDSMMPTIKPNEWLIIDMVSDGITERQFEKIDGLYLISRDGSVQIKRLAFKGTKGVDIISDNPMYQKENTLNDSIELYIIGKLFKHVQDLGHLALKN